MNCFAKAYHQDLDRFIASVVPQKTRSVIFSQKPLKGKYDYIILPNTVHYLKDVQSFINKLQVHCHSKTRVIVIGFNFFWKPLLSLATKLGFRQIDPQEPNWLTPADIQNLFRLENFEPIIRGKRLLLPINLGFISSFVNRFIAQLPIINSFCLTCYQIFKPVSEPKDYSASIIIPARNEAGNMPNLLDKIPVLGTKSEVIFVEGHSKDNTLKAIKKEISRHGHQKHQAFVYKQKGIGKADAVRLGFSKAKHDLLIILDADLTVNPKELPKFYQALASGQAELVNGSRLVYPMEHEAMRNLNYLGNKFFSLAFSYLLNQTIKDTLCGTKALLKSDYERIRSNRHVFGDFDPFGDYDLLFGATKLNLKIVEIPIRYRDRTYGSTNINRFTHGWLLLKMTHFAAKKIKFV